MSTRRVLADSSIWIDHINRGDPDLAAIIRRRRVLLHEMVIGEIALGSLRRRAFTLTELAILPQAPTVSHSEVLEMIERQGLHGVGIGYVDAHLLAAARAVGDCALWTRDKRLHAQAERLEVAYAP